MSVQSEIDRITGEVSNIRTALNEKGISASTHKLADFDNDIRSIPSKPYKRRIKCVVTNGDHYYNTGLVPNSDWCASGVFKFNELGTNLGVFGTRSTTTASSTQSWYVYTNSANHLYMNKHGKTIEPNTANANKTIRNVSNVGRTIAVNDGTILQTGTATAATGTCSSSYPLYLLSINTPSQNYPIFKGHLYRFTLFNHSTGDVYADYIPVLDYNDKACLYDCVSGQLLYHVGSGDMAYY